MSDTYYADGRLSGEFFETDYLAESGYIHLFAPMIGRSPRMSAGCVKLIEPIEDRPLED